MPPPDPPASGATWAPRSWLGEADKVLGAFEHDRRVSVVRVGADGFRDENTIHARTEPDQFAVGIAIELVDGATTGSANAADPLKRLAVLSKEFSPQPLIFIGISHSSPPV